jgi:carbamoyltransferase
MKVLGLHGSSELLHQSSYNYANFHDAAAALVMEGRIVCAFEEERLNRIKHTNKVPLLAVTSCLRYANISLKDVDYITLSEEEDAANAAMGVSSIRSFLKEFFYLHFGHAPSEEKFLFYDHHFTHATSALYTSPFKDCLILTIDGAGNYCSGKIFKCTERKLAHVTTFDVKKSLGHFYTFVTGILGFNYFDDYKVMGLAPYGDPTTYRKLFRSFYSLLPRGNYEIYPDKVCQLYKQSHLTVGSRELTQIHKDIAASLQESLEEIVIHILSHYRKTVGSKNLVLSGGVALNCSMNGKILNSGLFDNCFVFPAANDSGLPIGSALAGYFEKARLPIHTRVPLADVYLGNDIGDADIIRKKLSEWTGFISFVEKKNICKVAGKLLTVNKVIGWVQGRSEFGPRSLGNRSILANPMHADNKERINLMVKKRESFRPFAPSVLEEKLIKYFETPNKSAKYPYMTIILKVKKKYHRILGAVTHVDGTARVQTVSKETNRKYWDLIDSFGKFTGIPILLNTSFNNNSEPIVDSVTDSIVCFLTTGIDYLVIGDFLVKKTDRKLREIGSLVPRLSDYVRLSKISFPCQSGGVPSDEYQLLNTYSDFKVDIDVETYNALLIANGKSTVSEIFDKMSLDLKGSGGNKLREKFLELWGKRLIRLYPVDKHKDHKLC